MKEALEVIAGLEACGLIRRYAIGGGMAVVFHAEPVLTYDLDVFVFLPECGGGGLVDPSPLYRHLVEERGYVTEGECIVIAGVPVQFIPAYNALVEEAVESALEVSFERTATRVVRAEHLVAVMLETWRPKDRERLVMLYEQAKMDQAVLHDILTRHGLLARWEEFLRRLA